MSGFEIMNELSKCGVCFSPFPILYEYEVIAVKDPEGFSCRKNAQWLTRHIYNFKHTPC